MEDDGADDVDPSDADADAAGTVSFGLGVERVSAVEGDDVTVDFEFGDGRSGGPWKLGLNQNGCGPVFEQE
ncbi:hypothetical protein Acr_21g0004920 [Actinidia rufa]|uniref:Uncharacterized protein n=1 Tax=Actinidia rufa TaxID=165716 RepID=A0A7J0GGE6_9ERIC|nr:hypothetical protein Acr_21g0004920 [Actinidia rufa]